MDFDYNWFDFGLLNYVYPILCGLICMHMFDCFLCSVLIFSCLVGSLCHLFYDSYKLIKNKKLYANMKLDKQTQK